MDLVNNKNQADIINYRPSLNMDNVLSLSTFGGNGNLSKVAVKPPLGDKSIGLSSFEENTPSSVIENIENMIINIGEYKNELSNHMSKTSYGSRYLNAKDDVTRDKVAKENAESVMGTTYLESYIQLDSIDKELQVIKEVYSEATYGEHIQASRATEIDNVDIDKFSTLEREGDTDNINYTSLYYETMIANMMNRYCFYMEDTVIPDIGNLTEIKKTIPISDKLSSLMSQNFGKKHDLLKKDILKDKKTYYNMRVALRNAFLAIQEYEDSLDAIKSSLTDLGNDTLALDLQRDLLTNLRGAMECLLSIATYSIMAKEDISRSMMNKSNIREYFIE